MKIRVRSGVAAGAALAIAIAGQAMAVTVVNTSTPIATGPASKAFLSTDGTATNLVQRIVIPEAIQVTSIGFFGGGTDIDLFLTNMVGAGASDVLNVMWSTSGFTATGLRAWRDFAVEGLVLNPGTYFLVMASDDPSGGNWTRASRFDENALNVEARGAGTYVKSGAVRSASVNYTFEESDTRALATRVQGVAIPAPGAAALLGVAGLVGVARRRR